MPILPRLSLFLTLGLIATASGCVQRTMRVESDPPGALVYMNSQEIGRTPLQRDFTWYGNYDVEVRRDGYQTLKTNTWVVAPWWQWPPFDLFAELWPGRLRDVRKIQYTLEPIPPEPAPVAEILSRAEKMRGQLEGSRLPPPPAAAADDSPPPATPSTDG
jgi:hypothetical protein